MDIHGCLQIVMNLDWFLKMTCYSRIQTSNNAWRYFSGQMRNMLPCFRPILCTRGHEYQNIALEIVSRPVNILNWFILLCIATLVNTDKVNKHLFSDLFVVDWWSTFSSLELTVVDFLWSFVMFKWVSLVFSI